MSPITPYSIRSPRLLLRCWEPADAPALAELVGRNLEHLRPWMPWANDENANVETQYSRLRKARARFDLDEDYIYGVFSRDGKTMLGSSGLMTRAGDEALEIGYWLDKDHTGQGLATEASAAQVRVAFVCFQVKRVEIHCDPYNLASAAIPRKLGFTLDGTLRRRTSDYYNQPSDSMIWSLFSEEYPGSPAAELAVEAFDAAGRKVL